MSGIPLSCGHCGRPIGGVAYWIGSFVYHEECTRGPAFQQPVYLPMPADPTPRYYGELTEDRVRQIVREELKANQAKESRP